MVGEKWGTLGSVPGGGRVRGQLMTYGGHMSLLKKERCGGIRVGSCLKGRGQRRSLEDKEFDGWWRQLSGEDLGRGSL